MWLPILLFIYLNWQEHILLFLYLHFSFPFTILFTYYILNIRKSTKFALCKIYFVYLEEKKSKKILVSSSNFKHDNKAILFQYILAY